MLNNRNDGWRLGFHLMPPAGWLNDPNGLCQFRGTYHVYFQYSPVEKAPDGRSARTWGHYAGPDLLHLTFRGVPFWPEELDHDGCYSGSALVEDGAIHLFYTGNVKEPGEHDYIYDGRISNTIHIATDGDTYGPKEFLFGTNEYPDECTRHVRDPKVWKENGRFYMVQGARMDGKKNGLGEDSGAVLLYESADMKHWALNKIIRSDRPFGYMWECPDYFAMGGQKFLSLCPQGVEAEEFRYQNIYQAGYYRVDGDLTDPEQTVRDFQEWDYGFDFYAPQSFVDEKGRRLFIGWVGMPDRPYDNPTKDVEDGWENALTVPRELTLRDGVICQNPIRELEDLRYGEEAVPSDGAFELTEGMGDIEISFPEGSDQSPWSVQIGEGLTLSYEGDILTMKLSERYGRGREERRVRIEKIENLRLLIDTSLLEVYTNEGKVALTTRFYPDYTERNHKLTISFNCPSALVRGWQMKKMETNL